MVITLLCELSLGKDWNRPDKDEACEHLQLKDID